MRASLKAFTAGMPCTRKLWASIWFLSTSTLARSTLPSRLVAARSSAGLSALHGPHQSAQKSTTTGTSRERSTTRSMKSCSPTSRISHQGLTVTFCMTTVCVGVPVWSAGSPSLPIRCTTSMPFVTLPSSA